MDHKSASTSESVAVSGVTKRNLSVGRTFTLAAVLLASVTAAACERSPSSAPADAASPTAHRPLFVQGQKVLQHMRVKTAKLQNGVKYDSSEVQIDVVSERRGGIARGRIANGPRGGLSTNLAPLSGPSRGGGTPPGLDTMYYADVQMPTFLAQEQVDSILTSGPYGMQTDSAGLSGIVVNPNTTGNPSNVISTYENGKLQSTISMSYTPTTGGWMLEQMTVTQFDTSGNVTATGVVEVEGSTQVGAVPRGMIRGVTDAVQNAADIALNAAASIVTPRDALAFEDCEYFARAMVISTAGMAVSAALMNPFGMFIAGAGVANAMYSYAACMERRKAAAAAGGGSGSGSGGGPDDRRCTGWCQPQSTR